MNGVEMPILGLHDQVIHIACHSVLHHELNFFPGLVDLYAIISRETEYDWDGLRSRARRYGLWRSTLVAIGTLYELYQISLPQSLIDEWRRLYRRLSLGVGVVFLDCYWVVGAEDVSLVKSKHGGFFRNLARWWWNQSLADARSDRLKGVMKILLPTRDRIAKQYGQSSGVMAILMQGLHIPLVLLLFVLLGPLIILGVPVFILYLRRKLAGRLIGQVLNTPKGGESGRNRGPVG
jgi:hypothetical protein